jgi:ligand-binding sensor domain-containing protein
LPDDHVTAIAQDTLGRIWMGHNNGMISFLDKSDKVVLFKPDEGSATATVSSILFDRKGNLWFSTFNDGLYYYVNNRLYRLDESDGMPDTYVYDLAEDADGRILAGTDGGLVICSLSDTKVTVDVIDYDDGLPDNIVRRISIDDRNYAWLATEDAGLVTINLQTKQVSTPFGRKWTYGSIYDFVLKDNKVWMSTTAGGLVI